MLLILLYSCLVLCWTVSVSALRFPLVRRSSTKFSFKTASPQNLASTGPGKDPKDVGFTTNRDLLYISNVKIAGTDFPVQLDTGSSDLWIKPPSDLAGATPFSPSVELNLTYGIGWAHGNVAQAPVSFAGFDIPNQAFLLVDQSNNPIFNFDAVGILGLGFTTISNLDRKIQALDPPSNAGKTILFNMFAQDPKAPNYIAFALQRSTDPTNDVVGSFSVGEVETQYEAITTTDHIPLWPPGRATRWTVLMDSYSITGKRFPVSSSIVGAPRNRQVVLLDSGTSYSYADPDIVANIYGQFPGAQYDAVSQQWTMPCSTGIQLTWQFAGREFDMHPLDVVTPQITPDGTADPKNCFGTIIPQRLSAGAGELDMIIGDNVLRSMYSLYDFGDFDSKGQMGDPYIQLLSLVNIAEAAADFKTIRGGEVAFSDSSAAPAVADAAGGVSDPLGQLAGYAPIGLALLGFNALVMTVAVIAGFVYFCRRGRRERNTNHTGSTAPLALTSVNSRSAHSHAYEQVPTVVEGDDDKFIPPKPLSDAGSMRASGSRPGSTTLRPGSQYQPSVRPTSQIVQKDVSSLRDAASVRDSQGSAGTDGRPSSQYQFKGHANRPSSQLLQSIQKDPLLVEADLLAADSPVSSLSGMQNSPLSLGSPPGASALQPQQPMIQPLSQQQTSVQQPLVQPEIPSSSSLAALAAAAHQPSNSHQRTPSQQTQGQTSTTPIAQPNPPFRQPEVRQPELRQLTLQPLAPSTLRNSALQPTSRPFSAYQAVPRAGFTASPRALSSYNPTGPGSPPGPGPDSPTRKSGLTVQTNLGVAPKPRASSFYGQSSGGEGGSSPLGRVPGVGNGSSSPLGGQSPAGGNTPLGGNSPAGGNVPLPPSPAPSGADYPRQPSPQSQQPQRQTPWARERTPSSPGKPRSTSFYQVSPDAPPSPSPSSSSRPSARNAGLSVQTQPRATSYYAQNGPIPTEFQRDLANTNNSGAAPFTVSSPGGAFQDPRMHHSGLAGGVNGGAFRDDASSMRSRTSAASDGVPVHPP